MKIQKITNQEWPEKAVKEQGSWIGNVDQKNNFMKPTYTERQGQFLAYIHQYSIVNGCAPAEADMQRFFQIKPPSVHSKVLTLERRGFIRRVPGQARSITLIVSPKSLPNLKSIQMSAGRVGRRMK